MLTQQIFIALTVEQNTTIAKLHLPLFKMATLDNF